MTPARRAAPLLWALLAATPVAAAAEPCAWTVEEITPARSAMAAGSVANARYVLAYTGVDPSVRVFYGFSAAADDLPDDPGAAGGPALLARLGAAARPLAAYLTSDGRVAYGVAADAAARGHAAVYLAAATAPVDPLERVGARITPLRALTVSRIEPEAGVATPTRGATDRHGPLPPRRPAVQAAPEVSARTELCWFRVAGG